MNRAACTFVVWTLTASLAGLASIATATAQQEPQQAPATPASTKVEKLAAWPTLKDTDKERVLAMAGQFRKADPALHEVAHKQLLAIGDAAMPLLFQQVTDQVENQNPQLFALFDTMLEPKHAALMAQESKKQKVELRRYLLLRLCRFTDPAMLPVLQAAIKDKDPATSFYGSLGALALQQHEALPAVLAYTKANWKTCGPLVAQVLPAARSDQAGTWVFEAIAKASAPDQMAGLRLVRYLAVKDQTVILRTYLNSSENTVKKEAVNAMRALHGEAPIENLSVFQAIEMAKEWLTKA